MDNNHKLVSGCAITAAKKVQPVLRAAAILH